MFVTGFHSIEEKVRSQKKNTQAGQSGSSAPAAGYKIYFSKPGPRVKKILAAAKEAGITCEQTEDVELDKMVSGLDETLRDHRGIVMEISGGGKQPSANLVDFDSEYGHRRDPIGYGKAIMEFDARIPEIIENLSDDDIMIICADHGNDPIHTGWDHTREHVPVIVYGKKVKAGVNLGVRGSFADIGATVCEYLGAAPTAIGTSFLSEILAE